MTVAVRRRTRRAVKPLRLLPESWELGRDCAHFVLPIVTVSEANQREHWAARHRRRARQRADVARILVGMTRNAKGTLPAFPLIVSLTRVVPSKRHLLDDDNGVSSLKAVRDEVARLLGVDDGDASVRWAYPPQQVGAGFGVLIEVRAAGDVRGKGAA